MSYVEKLTQDRLKQLVSYDPESGLIRWAGEKRSRVKIGALVGSKMKKGYLRAGIDKRLYMCHVIAWLYVYGDFPEGQIDHINGVKDDNRISNLRISTPSGNAQNKKHARSDSKSGLMGALRSGGSWIARLTTNGETTYLGKFKSPEDASKAYINAKRRFHPWSTL